jgi:hypothetical protein
MCKSHQNNAISSNPHFISRNVRRPMLHDPARHEPLTATPWSDDAAADGIARIADDAAGRFDPNTLWPTHPMDEPKDTEPYCMLYFGAAGIIYALRRLSAAGAPYMPRAFEPTVEALLERNRARTRDWDADVPSLLFGDVGILLLQSCCWKRANSCGGTARWPKGRAFAMAPPAMATRS